MAQVGDGEVFKYVATVSIAMLRSLPAPGFMPRLFPPGFVASRVDDSANARRDSCVAGLAQAHISQHFTNLDEGLQTLLLKAPLAKASDKNEGVETNITILSSFNPSDL